MSRSRSPIPHLWTSLGQRLAVALGAATAVVSLLWDTPVRVACLRGGAAWLALLLWTRIGRWLIERTLPDSGPLDAKGFEHGRF